MREKDALCEEEEEASKMNENVFPKMKTT